MMSLSFGGLFRLFLTRLSLQTKISYHLIIVIARLPLVRHVTPRVRHT